MKILAIDSSGLVASAALLVDGVLLAEYTVDYKKTHSQTLLPMVDEILRMTEQELSEMDAVAVSKGPGSFTGLRIGAATAKGLGLALAKPVIGVPTVDALAYNLYGTERLICPLMDARRAQVYTGIYTFSGEEFKVLRPQEVTAAEDIFKVLNGMGRPVVFLGDGVPVHGKLIEEKMEVPYSYAPPHLARQRAGAVGALAFLYYEAGNIQSAEEFAPVYLRPSQAEREREERLNAKKVQNNKME